MDSKQTHIVHSFVTMKMILILGGTLEHIHEGFVTSLDLIKCVKQIKFKRLLLTCARTAPEIGILTRLVLLTIIQYVPTYRRQKSFLLLNSSTITRKNT